MANPRKKKKTYHVYHDCSDDEHAYSHMICLSMDGRRNVSTQDSPVRLRPTPNGRNAMDFNIDMDAGWSDEENYNGGDGQRIVCSRPAKRYQTSVRIAL